MKSSKMFRSFYSIIFYSPNLENRERINIGFLVWNNNGEKDIFFSKNKLRLKFFDESINLEELEKLENFLKFYWQNISAFPGKKKMMGIC